MLLPDRRTLTVTSCPLSVLIYGVSVVLDPTSAGAPKTRRVPPLNHGLGHVWSDAGPLDLNNVGTCRFAQPKSSALDGIIMANRVWLTVSMRPGAQDVSGTFTKC
jgi:hypothetical protein